MPLAVHLISLAVTALMGCLPEIQAPGLLAAQVFGVAEAEPVTVLAFKALHPALAVARATEVPELAEMGKSVLLFWLI